MMRLVCREGEALTEDSFIRYVLLSCHMLTPMASWEYLYKGNITDYEHGP
jgi:hypothetical protein